jgi:hypothetical protein
VIAYLALAALVAMLAASVTVRRMRRRAEAEYLRILQRERELWRSGEAFGVPARPIASSRITPSSSHCITQPHTQMTYGALDGGSCDSGSSDSGSCGGGGD